MKRRIISLMLLLLACLMLFSACSLFGGVDEKKIVTYLTSVGSDFEKSKESLKVFDENISKDLAGITKALDIVKKSKSDFQSRMDSASKQVVPNKPEELAGFHNSLIQYYSYSVELMGEYEQILNYSQVLIKSISPMEKAVNTDLGKAPSMEEVKAMVKALKTSINESITIAKGFTPPQYMADSHGNYLTILTNFGSATDDFIYALQLEDPLRINATSYRYELLANKLSNIGDEMSKDIENQQVQMKDLGNKLQKSQDDLYRQLLLWQGQYKIGS